MRDPRESYHQLATARTPMVSPPRCDFFRAMGSRRDLDVMSRSPFGPAGEQRVMTANVRNDRPAWAEPGLHTVPTDRVIVTPEQLPACAFYERVRAMWAEAGIVPVGRGAGRRSGSHRRGVTARRGTSASRGTPSRIAARRGGWPR